jgi:hypothetical protein
MSDDERFSDDSDALAEANQAEGQAPRRCADCNVGVVVPLDSCKALSRGRGKAYYTPRIVSSHPGTAAHKQLCFMKLCGTLLKIVLVRYMLELRPDPGSRAICSVWHAVMQR